MTVDLSTDPLRQANGGAGPQFITNGALVAGEFFAIEATAAGATIQVLTLTPAPPAGSFVGVQLGPGQSVLGGTSTITQVQLSAGGVIAYRKAPITRPL